MGEEEKERIAVLEIKTDLQTKILWVIVVLDVPILLAHVDAIKGWFKFLF